MANGTMRTVHKKHKGIFYVLYILSIETFYRLGWVTQSDGTGIDLTQYLPFFHSTLCITTEYWHSTLEPSTIGNCLARQQVTLFGLKTLLDWRDNGRECPALINSMYSTIKTNLSKLGRKITRRVDEGLPLILELNWVSQL